MHLLEIVVQNLKVLHMNYPKQYETYFLTKDNKKITIRPLKTTDEHLLKDLYYSLDKQSMYFRFCEVGRNFCDTVIQQEVNIDYHNIFCLCALVGEISNKEMVGTAGFYLNPNTNTAEFSFVVKKLWRNKGIGQYLLHHLIMIANEKGIKGFYGTIHFQNKNTIHIIKKSGYTKVSPPEVGEKELFFELFFEKE